MLLPALALLILNPVPCDPMMCTIEGCPPGCDWDLPPGGGPPRGVMLGADGDGGAVPIPIYAYDGRPYDRSWPLIQNLLTQEVAEGVCASVGCRVADVTAVCRWVSSYPPMLVCDGWDPDYFIDPFIWLFNQTVRGRDLLMIQQDQLMHWFGIPYGEIGDMCAGNHVFCRWAPTLGPDCPPSQGPWCRGGT